MTRTAAIAGLLALTGCIGPLVDVTKVDQGTAADLERSVAVYEPAATPRGAAVMGPITATSCMNKIWDNPATKEDAVAQLRHHARIHGANAVGNLMCQQSEGTSLAKNCWNSVTCSGSAMRVTQANPPR